MLFPYVVRLAQIVFCPWPSWVDLVTLGFGLAVPIAIQLSSEGPGSFDASTAINDLSFAVLLLLLVRLIRAPYLLWRELILYISELHDELDQKANAERQE